LRIQFLDAAAEELEEVFQYYDSQRVGLGHEFLREVGDILDIIEKFPQSWPVIYGESRRALIKRFPFGLFYYIDDRLIVVTAVMDLRKDPKSY